MLGAGVVVLLGASACKKTEPAAATSGASAPAASPSSSSPAAPTPPASSAAAPAVAASPAPAPVPVPVPDAVRKILGHWLRADGGYVLELRRAEMSGVLEAHYFNPNPIKVSRAIWMQGGGGLQVMVELTDVGYPGATYVLMHDAATDRLMGKYNQPQMQQTFDVEFVRQKKP